MTVFGALPPPERRKQRHLADRLLELVHGGHRHRIERRRQQAAEQRALGSHRALEQPIDEVHDEQGVKSLEKPHEEHLRTGIVYPDLACESHDRGDNAGVQRRAVERHRETHAGRDLIRSADDDVVIVAGEEAAAENRREQPQRCCDDENADQRPVYWSSPVFRTFW